MYATPAAMPHAMSTAMDDSDDDGGEDVEASAWVCSRGGGISPPHTTHAPVVVARVRRLVPGTKKFINISGNNRGKSETTFVTRRRLGRSIDRRARFDPSHGPHRTRFRRIVRTFTAATNRRQITRAASHPPVHRRQRSTACRYNNRVRSERCRRSTRARARRSAGRRSNPTTSTR